MELVEEVYIALSTQAITGLTLAATCLTRLQIALWLIPTTLTRYMWQWIQAFMSQRKLRIARRPTVGASMVPAFQMCQLSNLLQRSRCALEMARPAHFGPLPTDGGSGRSHCSQHQLFK